MKSTFKKIGAILLALAIVLSLGVTAFAADDDGDVSGDGTAGNTSGVWATADTPVVQTAGKVTLYKEIKAYNPESSTVNAPTITYSYTVAPGSANKDLYDNESNHASGRSAHVLTKAGITTGVVVGSGSPGDASSATGTITWSPSVAADQLSATSAGQKNVKPIAIDFSGVTFTGAGVYRYVITETATSYTSSGVVQGATGHTRYLDVYVKDSSTTPGSYEIYGFVCFVNDNSIDGRNGASSNTPAAAIKTEGFVEVLDPDGDGNHSDDMTADQYYTFNLTVKKVLTGDQAMNNHQFPFKVTFSNTTVTANVLPIVTSDGTVTAPTLTAAAISSYVLDGKDGASGSQIKLANNGSVTFTGIPAGTTVTIDEYNDVTGTVYTTTTANATTNEADGISLGWSAWASADDNWADQTDGTGEVTALGGTANTNAAAASNFTASGAGAVIFTNDLLTISPTGVTLRVAPYVLMLAAGLFLVLFTRRRKEENEA